MIMRFEVCADSVAGVLAAQRAGADRVELCSGLFEGGITPSAGLLVATAAVAEIPVMVLIRPRGGDFCYDEHERRAMITDIAMARETGAAGVVIGALSADGNVDVELCAELIRAADGMEITFHRAFDLARDPFAALEAVISLGAQRLLTSGQDRSALDGAELIKQLVQRAGDRLIV